MDKLVEVGKQLGLEGDKLHHFVIEQQEKERSDRAYRRDYEREMDERKRAHEMVIKEAEFPFFSVLINMSRLKILRKKIGQQV